MVLVPIIIQKETVEHPAVKLKELLESDELLLMPCCFDALSARLVEEAGFKLTFMSGFAVSAARFGLPDTGLVSYGEMVEQGRTICSSVSIPVIGDADTGYGNAVNVKRTVHGYGQAGFGCVMIEDQVSPKRCGHTRVKQVVERAEAVQRIKAAVDAREEGAGVLIMGRTDARTTDGLKEALWRLQAFADCGADILFLEAPQNKEEMQAFCSRIPGPKMANMLEQGKTPYLAPGRLQEMGFKIAAYPLTLLSSAARAMGEALAALKKGEEPGNLLDFTALQDLIGFEEYFDEEKRYQTDDR